MIERILSSFITSVAPNRTGLPRGSGKAVLAALMIALTTGAGPALAQGRAGSEDLAEHRGPLDFAVANPSEVVATEEAFARAAQENGQWAAFAQYAADDAVMFVPQAVNAQDWLRGRPNPARAVNWQTHEVWMSCDGSLAVTRGAWDRPDGSVGYFTTVWALRPNQGGGYHWLLDQGDTLAEPLAAPAAVEETVGDCPFTGSQRMSESDLASLDAEALRAGATKAGSGWSADGTLAYRYSVAPSGAREFVVLIVKGGSVQEVIRSEVAAQ